MRTICALDAYTNMIQEPDHYFHPTTGSAEGSNSPFNKIHYTQIGALVENYWLHPIHIIHIDWTLRILTLSGGTVHHFINHCLWLKIRWCLYWSWSIIDSIGLSGYATTDKTLFYESITILIFKICHAYRRVSDCKTSKQILKIKRKLFLN